MRTRLAAVLVALALFCPMGAALAQGHPHTRQGFNIGFGVGFGNAGIRCDGCDLDRQNGGTGYLFIGGTVSPQLTIGGELNGWAKSSDDEDDSIGSLMAVAHYYPLPTNGLFVLGGAGVTGMELKDKILNDKLESAGFGLEVGGGYDWRVARNFSLTPYVQYVHAFGAEAKLNGTNLGENANPNFVQFGLGFTWH
jgi:opacity protein-like surface antigen